VAAGASKERRPGDTVAGRFRLVAKLGHGTMGSVWSAEHLTLRVRVAVKFMDGQAAVSDRTALLRFEQEARAAAMIQSPHVVSILDFGKDSGGMPYLAMELLQGQSLEQRLTSGRLDIEQTNLVVTQTCRGLERAHAAGIIHRDIKPENIFLSQDPGGGYTVKIFDFGIAKSFGSNISMNLTGTGQMLGTPIFMSPEQAFGHPIDARSDLYSLGVVAFNCLTGHLPFEDSKTVGELVVAIAMKVPPPITKWRKDVSQNVIAWFEKVLQKKPDERFQNAREMAEAFDEACAIRKMAISFSGFDVDESAPSSSKLGAQQALSIEAARRLSFPPEPPRTSRPPPAPTVPARRKRDGGPSTVILILAGLVLFVGGIAFGLALARLRP
jgi:serine/threonine-protein kinase